MQYSTSSIAASTLEEGGHIFSEVAARAILLLTEGPPGAPAPTSAVLLQGRHKSIQQYSSATGIFFTNRT